MKRRAKVSPADHYTLLVYNWSCRTLSVIRMTLWKLREYLPRPWEPHRSLRRRTKVFRSSQSRRRPARAMTAPRMKQPTLLRIVQTSNLCLMIQTTPNRLLKIPFHLKKSSMFSSHLLKEWRLPLYRSPRLSLRFRIQYKWSNRRKSKSKVAPRKTPLWSPSTWAAKMNLLTLNLRVFLKSRRWNLREIRQRTKGVLRFRATQLHR